MTRPEVSATATKQPALQQVGCVVTPRSSSLAIVAVCLSPSFLPVHTPSLLAADRAVGGAAEQQQAVLLFPSRRLAHSNLLPLLWIIPLLSSLFPLPWAPCLETEPEASLDCPGIL